MNGLLERSQLEVTTCQAAAAEIAERGKADFSFFHRHIASIGISKIERGFKWGWHIGDLCSRLDRYQYTSTEAARRFSKSVTIRSYVMWQLFKVQEGFTEWDYFSFIQKLAGDHLRKAKRYIDACPEYFSEYKSLSDAATLMRYEAPNGGQFECRPQGILGFKRGVHDDGLILDDILSDPTNSLELSVIAKITRIFQEEIASIPREHAPLHLVGTSQDASDIFHILRENPAFDTAQYPAEVIRDGATVALWPEVFPLDRLEKVKALMQRKRVYDKEYLLQPVRMGESFFMPEELEVKGHNLKPGRTPLDYGLAKYDVVAGADIGKKRHPSHLSVLVVIPLESADEEGETKTELIPLEESDDLYSYIGDPRGRMKAGIYKRHQDDNLPDDYVISKVGKKYRLKQILSKWFDGTDYTEQLDYFKSAIRSFGISKMIIDNTRAEFDALDELGMVPREIELATMTARRNREMASLFDQAVGSASITFVNDDRQVNQICVVDNNLKAPETELGHGDAFFSNALAVQAAEQGQPEPGMVF